DGGLASELSRSGFDLDHPLWSARVLTENPEAIEAVTRSFAAAGAELLATATYQATFPGLEKEGLSRPEAVRLFQRAIALTRRVADEFSHRPLVAASIGPYGAYLADGSEYRGNYGLTSKELAEFHRPRLEVLTDTAADLLAFETFPSAQEALAIADLLAEQFSDHEAWISFSCRDDSTLWDGTPIAEIAGKLRDHPVVTAIGVNCVHPDHTTGLVARLREAAPNRAVIVYPNAGRGWDAEAGRWSGTDSPAEFADRAQSWIDAGARIVGGCCLASPDHIAALRERFKPA
ncbi:MAG: homocysteine S-methyltransferase, partial [Verrucomicrobiae bacterium]|nr:homocysteine S-methyltransferase [Verrucomicrobiae bacterium]